ncbi:MAG TPA: exodeoxyribonuclease III [Bacteroidales bacterium]|nr:exodeoxyribonuclease III [Bacteroidales bacterium]
MKIITYNVNGIRAAIEKGLLRWIQDTSPDIVCFQEIKALEENIPVTEFEKLGYYHYWHPAQKKGYSGVGILTKIKPDKVVYGIGNRLYDDEGRFLRIDLDGLSVISVYHPSGTTGQERQDFKMQWLEYFRKHILELRRERPKLVISGDYNICHRPIDIHDPVRNATSSGFLPEERAWMSSFLLDGYIDTFRYFNNEPHHYTWWSYRAGARNRNLGWRIDYHMVTGNLEYQLKRAAILPLAKHSDHCPALLEIEPTH